MKRTLRLLGGLALFADLTCMPACAQNTQILPEIDGHLTVNSRVRLELQVKDDREGGDSSQATVGPSMLFYLKPLSSLERMTNLDIDTTKARPLIFETGYRVIAAPDTPVEDRAIEAITYRVPLLHGLLVSDRNRADLDWLGGNFTWRYRNGLTLERTFAVGSRTLIPYIAAEPFYESKYGKWSCTDLYAGLSLNANKHVELIGYYEHENDTGKKINTQHNYIGAILGVYFDLRNVRRSNGSDR